MKSNRNDGQQKSGMSDNMKNFLLSLLATTISIALTFGTAAVIDNNKKEQEKQEIVMMVMYDMYSSLKSMEDADSCLLQSMRMQKQLAQDTTLFENLRFQIGFLVPKADFTETTERIFSSSIETINTVGNVLFTENVAEFYQNRKLYQTIVCDSVANEIYKNQVLTSIPSIVNFNFFAYALQSNELLNREKKLFDICKNLIGVTETELEAYRKERERIDQSKEYVLDDDPKVTEIMELQESISKAVKKMNLK